MRRGFPITHVDPQEVIAAYQSGKSMREVAEEFGVSLTWVYERLRRAKIERRSRSQTSATIKRIIELRHQGLSQAQVAFVMGMSRTNVRDRLQRAGDGM